MLQTGNPNLGQVLIFCHLWMFWPFASIQLNDISQIFPDCTTHVTSLCTYQSVSLGLLL